MRVDSILIFLTSLMAAVAQEGPNSTQCLGTVAMPTFNCNCNHPKEDKVDRPEVERMNTVGTYASPGDSCEEIALTKPHQLPSYQWIKNCTFDSVLVYCTASTQCCSQGDVGWMRVANFDMSNPNQDCPQGFQLYSTPIRSCGRTLTSGGCQSMHFDTQGVEYSKVCGRVIAYQFGTPSGFYNPRLPSSIDNVYIEGVSITHGSSLKKHIWSFANGLLSVEGFDDNKHMCPCASPNSRMQQFIPSFVGNDYFCDTGSTLARWQNRFYHENPLWDGSGCNTTSTCCSFNNPPWFCKTISEPTTDDIELRLCADGIEDVALESIEIYVQ